MQTQQYQRVAALVAKRPKGRVFVIRSLLFLYFFIRFANLLQMKIWPYHAGVPCRGNRRELPTYQIRLPTAIVREAVLNKPSPLQFKFPSDSLFG